ncbi:MAG: hypothetical protein QOI83_4238 [Streptomycetaceae bacterium]|nr:hypothetical protein [Streptomycetaceae bacterium]
MQNRTVKTLGAAVLGAAFAVTAAAGAASAAEPTAPAPGVPAGLPISGGPLKAVTGVLPGVTKLGPGNFTGSDPVSGLLGGLPTQALSGAVGR